MVQLPEDEVDLLNEDRDVEGDAPIAEDDDDFEKQLRAFESEFS